MSQPTPYSRSTSFTNTFAANPTQVFPGNALDTELNNVKTTLDQTLSNLALLQNDDGSILNGSIGPQQLSAAITLGFTVPTVWAPGVAYSASPASTVFENNKFYSCLKSNQSSGSFAADLAAGDWVLIVDLTSIPLQTAVQIAVTPAGNITQNNVQAALQQLDGLQAGKAPGNYSTLLSANITDSTTAGRALLTAATPTVPSTSISDSTAVGRAMLTAATISAQADLFTRRTRQVLTSGTTYITPANCVCLFVVMVGGGGGGGATGTASGTNATAGGTTSFNSVTVVGGALGVFNNGTGSGTGGAGGSGGSGAAASLRIPGQTGGGSPSTANYPNNMQVMNAAGGNSHLGNGAPITNAGSAPNGSGYGAGGGGAGTGVPQTLSLGGGGGGGEYAEMTINNPTTSYTYAIGAAGAAGAGGISGANGGAGTAGVIIVDEFYV